MNWYTQDQWDEMVTAGAAREIRHPYYEVDGEVRKVMAGKARADAAYGLTAAERAAPDDAVYLDPLAEEDACRDMIEVAVDEYIEYRASQYRERHADLVAQGLDVVVDRNYEGGTENVIGFRLSMDSDSRSHGVDETEGVW